MKTSCRPGDGSDSSTNNTDLTRRDLLTIAAVGAAATVPRATLAAGSQLDFGHSSSIAGDVYQAVECDVGEFGNIVYLTRRFKTASGP
jgi:hypothetical protein